MADESTTCKLDGPVTAAISAANAAFHAAKVSRCYAKKSEEAAEGGGGGVGGYNPIEFGNGSPSGSTGDGTVYIDRDTYDIWQYNR